MFQTKTLLTLIYFVDIALQNRSEIKLKIVDVVKSLEPSRTIDKILNYILQNEDSVFSYYDEELKKAFENVNEETLANYLYTLGKQGKIQRTKINREVFFGSQKAIDDFIKSINAQKR